MAADRIVLKCNENEDIFFKEQEREQIKAFREKSLKKLNEKYAEEHKYHCFRCGTKSLIEVRKGKCIVDVCINEDCGAVHLDPGELEAILQDKRLIRDIKKSISNIFK